MSAIAEFILIETSALPALRKAAIPTKRFLRPPLDRYSEFLRKNGREVAHYEWSGLVLPTLYIYLQEERQVDLLTSEHDELATYVGNKRGFHSVILTASMRKNYSERLASLSFSEDALRDYFNEFNEVQELDSGRWMFDGIRCIRQALESVDDGHVVIVSIG